jgi:hypothetical protein
MSAPSIDTRMLEALTRASSIELYQLSAAIERLMADPRRIVQIRKDLHLVRRSGSSMRAMARYAPAW